MARESSITQRPQPASQTDAGLLDAALDVVSAMRNDTPEAIDPLLEGGCVVRQPLRRLDVRPASGVDVLTSVFGMTEIPVARVTAAFGVATIELEGWRDGAGGLIVCHFNDDRRIHEILVFAGELDVFPLPAPVGSEPVADEHAYARP